MEIKPCPFCGSTDIKYSIKNAPDKVDSVTFEHSYRFYIAMYCNECHCLGKRTLIDTHSSSRKLHEKCKLMENPIYQTMAIEAWNTRI